MNELDIMLCLSRALKLCVYNKGMFSGRANGTEMKCVMRWNRTQSSRFKWLHFRPVAVRWSASRREEEEGNRARQQRDNNGTNKREISDESNKEKKKAFLRILC